MDVSETAQLGTSDPCIILVPETKQRQMRPTLPPFSTAIGHHYVTLGTLHDRDLRVIFLTTPPFNF
jgi:hypothetical protein